MPDKSPFIRKLLNERGDLPEDNVPYTSERQLTAQAFNLHVEKRDGLHAEGFAWSHYVRCQWTNEGEHERLIVLFTGSAVEIVGHNLGVLLAEIREGQLNSIREMPTAHVQLKESEADDKPIIISIKTYPDIEELLKELKGDDRETGHAGRVRGR